MEGLSFFFFNTTEQIRLDTSRFLRNPIELNSSRDKIEMNGNLFSARMGFGYNKDIDTIFKTFAPHTVQNFKRLCENGFVSTTKANILRQLIVVIRASHITISTSAALVCPVWGCIRTESNRPNLLRHFENDHFRSNDLTDLLYLPKYNNVL